MSEEARTAVERSDVAKDPDAAPDGVVAAPGLGEGRSGPAGLGGLRRLPPRQRAAVLARLSSGGGNAALARLIQSETRLILRAPPATTPPQPGQGTQPAGSELEDTARKLSDYLGKPELHKVQILDLCSEMRNRYADLAAAWKKTGASAELDASLRSSFEDKADAARALAYLRHGELRVADKIYFASIGAGTDEDTLWRILPQAHDATISTVDGDLKADYGKDYSDDGTLPPDNHKSRTAGVLEDELSGADLIKGKALLAFGKVRAVDELEMAFASGAAGDILAALRRIEPKGQAAKVYKEAWGEAWGEGGLERRLKGFLGDRDLSRALLIASGDYTPIARLRIACEALVPDMKEIFAAFSEATDDERKELKKQWDDKGEVYTLIHGKLLISDTDIKRIEALLENKTGALDRLQQRGIDPAATKDVIEGVLKDEVLETAFADDYKNREGAFFKTFTGVGASYHATEWGDKVVYGTVEQQLSLGAEFSIIEYVTRVLTRRATDEDSRKRIRENEHLMARLEKIEGWRQIDGLVQPLDPKLRSEWLDKKFQKEKSDWADSRQDAAFRDEKRELDHMLASVKDPKNLTDGEKKKLGLQMKSTEDALQTYMKARDEMEAIATTVATTAAGLLVTILTGGAGAAVAEEMLSAEVAMQVARAAMANALAKVLATKAIKGDRFELDSNEALVVAESGAVEGAASVLAAPAAMKMISVEYRTAGNSIAKEVAAKHFEQIGPGVLKAAIEGGMSGGASGAFESAARKDAWKDGFIDGFKGVMKDAFKGAATSAAAGSAVEALKLSLFAHDGAHASADAAAGGHPATIPPPSAVNPVSAARVAREMTLSLGQDWAEWRKTVEAMGEHAAVGKTAFATARGQIVDEAWSSLLGDFDKLGVQTDVSAVAPMEGRMRVSLKAVEQTPDFASSGKTPRDVDKQFLALLEANDKLRAKLKELAGGEPETRLDTDVSYYEGEAYAFRALHEMPKSQFDAIMKVVLSEVKSGQRRLVKCVPKHYTRLTEVDGYITDIQSVLGRTPEELASILGVASLDKGATVYELTPAGLQTLTEKDIGLRGYTQSPGGHSPDIAPDRRYPVGQGSPQWELIRGHKKPVVKLADLDPGSRFTIADTP